VDIEAELFYALSECYKEPSADFAYDVAAGNLYQVMADGFTALAIKEDLVGLRLSASPQDAFQTLKRAYYPLFVIPPRFALPVESVYKEWAGEGNFLAGSQGMIMGPSAVDMLQRYKQRDIAIPRTLRDYPDHLALLLEYGGLLCTENDQRALAQFVAAHLDDWIERFRDQVYACSQSAFYRTVATATVAFVQYERRLIQVRMR
jgi:TorA maturation chaperone TorD